MRFIWIDDNLKREETANNLQAELEITCEFVNVYEKSVGSVLKELLLNGEEPDLIIIDHNLIDTLPEEHSKERLIRKGSSAAAIIREKWKRCPIVCVTGMATTDVDVQQKAIYEAFIPEHYISKYYREIYSIAESFSNIKTKEPKSIIEIITLLNAPEEDSEKIISILPKNLKENINDGSLVVEISNWVRKVLLLRPGFLYNKIWASTLLGVNEAGFSKIEHIFESAKYNGVFAYEGNERWWKSKVLEILTKAVKTPGLPWERGRSLSGLTEKDFSRCHATGVEFPETVAYKDPSPDSEEVAIKLKQTSLHPDYDKLLYFEDIRIMDN